MTLHGSLDEPRLHMLYFSVKAYVAPLMPHVLLPVAPLIPQMFVHFAYRLHLIVAQVINAMEHGLPIVASPSAVTGLKVVDVKSGMYGVSQHQRFC